MELTIDLHGLTHKKALLKVEEHLLTSELYKLANTKVITGNSPELQNKIIKDILVPYKFDYYIVIILACSFFMLIAGSDLFINSAINIADSLGVSKVAISLTMVAIGTSLPELATSIIAAIKKEHDLLIGNIIGSNIMNILMVLGTSILVNEINMLINYKALITLLAVTIFIYIYSILKINFSRIIAFILLSIYLSLIILFLSIINIIKV